MKILRYSSSASATMSWLARSIANSLKLEDDENPLPPNPNSNPQSDNISQSSSPRGVKEDISELTQTLSRQFWGVASFLAPPPPDSPPSSPPLRISDGTADDRPSDPELANEDLIAGIRSDFAEIGGRFKSGISKLSSNVGVSEITKIASSFLQIGSDRDLNDEDLVGGAVGVTEEVVFFARDVALHPETWLDFPVPNDDFDEFDMSDAQQEHALAVEHLAPGLAALRIELCPGYMSEGCFWKIYFVLVHPKLSKQDAELLSTPQIVEARAMLSHELKNRNEGAKSALSGSGTYGSSETANLPREESLSVPSSSDNSEPNKKPVFEVLPLTVSETAPANEPPPSGIKAEIESEKHAIQSTEIRIVDKAVVEESSVSHNKNRNIPITSSKVQEEEDNDTDYWLKAESSEIAGPSGSAVHIENDEDVSFSDLEDDDDDIDGPTSYKKVISVSDGSSKDSQPGQVSARNSDSRESNDWLDVDDIDVM